MREETMNMMEEELQRQLINLKEMDWDQDLSKRSKAVSELVQLSERLTEAENANEKWYDNQERRDIEKERNRITAVAESRKQDMDWKHMLIEVGKIIAPPIVSLVTLKVWRNSFVDMIGFETTGHFTTSASRELHLPKIFTKI